MAWSLGSKFGVIKVGGQQLSCVSGAEEGLFRFTRERAQPFNEPRASQQHLPLHLLPGRHLAYPLRDEGPVLPLGCRTLLPELGQQSVHSQKRRDGARPAVAR